MSWEPHHVLGSCYGQPVWTPVAAVHISVPQLQARRLQCRACAHRDWSDPYVELYFGPRCGTIFCFSCSVVLHRNATFYGIERARCVLEEVITHEVGGTGECSSFSRDLYNEC
jgi:hypothetical protein